MQELLQDFGTDPEVHYITKRVACEDVYSHFDLRSDNRNDC